MKALIMAGGRGGNLEPFTTTRPTTMVYVSGRPVLENIFSLLKTAGINDCRIVTGHKGNVIREHFTKNIALDMNIEYIDQGKSSSIGEALYCARDSFMPGEYFLLIYADVITSDNIYSTLLRSFNTFREPMASVCLTPSTKNYGNIFLGSELRITEIIEKPSRDDLGNYVLAGVFVLPQQFFPLLEKCSCKMENALNLLIDDMGFRASIWEKPWIDVRYPWNILTGNKMIMDSWQNAQIHNSVKLIGDVKVEGPVHIDENVEIQSGTVVKGPCYIGKNCYIGNNTLIRPYTSIGPHSSIGYGMELKNCVIFSNAVFGRLSFIGDSIVGEGADIGSGTMTINRKLDSTSIEVVLNGERINTELTKLGAFIGDGVTIGASNTLGAGSIITANTEIGHNFSWPSNLQDRSEVS